MLTPERDDLGGLLDGNRMRRGQRRGRAIREPGDPAFLIAPQPRVQRLSRHPELLGGCRDRGGVFKDGLDGAQALTLGEELHPPSSSPSSLSPRLPVRL